MAFSSRSAFVFLRLKSSAANKVTYRAWHTQCLARIIAKKVLLESRSFRLNLHRPPIIRPSSSLLQDYSIVQAGKIGRNLGARSVLLWPKSALAGV